MSDLRDPRLISLKAGLFFAGGCISCALILLEFPSWKLAALLGLAVWCFCRAYYFAFYVIEHYIDPAYRFSGLWSFMRYLRRRGWAKHSAAIAVRDDLPPESVVAGRPADAPTGDAGQPR